MHIKFINTGKGSAKSAKEYLLREHDHKGEIRQKVEVLRGNPDQVTAVAESLEFKHTYRSAVIAWHKDDQPTPEQIQEVLDDFERVAFAGLEPNQYTYYAVWHGESNGSGHIHIITPRVELQTGKSMNIAPPGWQSTYDLIVDKYNTKYDWASPKEKHRQHLAINDKLKIHADMKQIEAKKMIDKAVIDRIDAGLIKDHSDVKSYLAQFGEITRTGKDYISVKPNGFKKAIRLKGTAYGREFNAERLGKEVRAEQRERSHASAADRRREVTRIESAIKRTIEQRAIYNRRRYDYKAVRLSNGIDRSETRDRQAGKGLDAADQRSAVRDRGRGKDSQADPNKYQSETVDHTVSDRDLNRGRVGNRGMEPWSIRNAPASSDRGQQKDHSRTGETDKRAEQDQGQVYSEGMEKRYRGEEGARSLVGQIGHGALDRAIRERQRELNDRIRERITRDSQATARDFHARANQGIAGLREEFVNDRTILQEANERSNADHQEAERHDSKAEPVIEQVRERIRRNKDNFGSRAIESLRESAQRFAQSFGRIGELRQRISRAVERCIERAVERVQEIKTERRKQQQRSRSSGWSMGRR
jgi:hypothetical protein